MIVALLSESQLVFSDDIIQLIIDKEFRNFESSSDFIEDDIRNL
ncbi:hypothetical protein Ahy_B03g064507 isoform B [Arachis hypogaea]|uniref:Uncharacterized protein n=1 Tax=Arachis hypogaea TaxID=3818 RepID=A0A444ZZN9_ARAHY|nr:hypothetical protein Ahy_B03g064507 isoform B [Arachis hypogaea]